MTKSNEIFETLFFTNKPPEPGLILSIPESDSMEIRYNAIIECKNTDMIEEKIYF
jgi:hypothetical protein